MASASACAVPGPCRDLGPIDLRTGSLRFVAWPTKISWLERSADCRIARCGASLWPAQEADHDISDDMATGDLVKVELVEEVALFVRKASDPPVEAVDYQKRTITSRGAQGNITTDKVGDGVKRLNEVKPGDQVVLRVADALALLVEKS